MTSTTAVEIAGVAVSPDHWIGGQRVPSRERFSDLSPIDRAHLADVAAGGPVEVDAAVRAARDAFPAWAALGPEGRAPILRAVAARIRERNDELARLETEDNGSLLLGNLKRVINRGAHNIEFFAEHALTLRHPPIAGMVDNHVRFEPAGVAALIVPWNAPFMLGTWKIGPALAAGNTVVVKPPEWAPLTLSLLTDLAAEAGLPPGVFNVVQGIGEVAGAALVAHPEVDRISFTGSTETGQSIGQAAARNLTPVSFELGGKSPFIVFADADPDEAARTVAQQFVNAGQVCLAGTRLLIEERIADDFLVRVRQATASLPIGDPRDLATRIGPLITREHFARVKGFVDRARAEGAEPLLGGGPHPFGELWFQPTILGNVRQEREIVQHEVFGPVLTWQTFADEDEAVMLANGTRYGLAAMLFTGSAARAERVGARLVAGTVWVNCFFIRDLAAPFGGARRSGIGREGGNWSFDFFCDVKNLAIMRGTLA
jgi:aminomuconate-semialdehyde/2-hydroxymuconate-6-semialdehyde dehydrogenase